jgi:hypothetical protein
MYMRKEQTVVGCGSSRRREPCLEKTDYQSGTYLETVLLNGVAGEGDTLMCPHRPHQYEGRHQPMNRWDGCL